MELRDVSAVELLRAGYEHVFVAHLVELWEMKGEQRIVFTPACLNCGWIGSDTTRRTEALAEGRLHEEGRRHPWVIGPGERRTWDGEPGSSSAVGPG
jgi:hypothetical protein